MSTRLRQRYLQWDPHRQRVFDCALDELARTRPGVHEVFEAIELRGVSLQHVAEGLPHTGATATQQLDIVRVYVWRGWETLRRLCGGNWIEHDDAPSET